MKKKEEILKRLYEKEEKKEDKNQLYIDRVKVYFLIDLYKQGIITIEILGKILSASFQLDYFVRLVEPKADTIDIATMEKILNYFIEE
ncbi:MAG: hypothetical protein QXS37_05605 [Candidatus Aenigmatarchaeota archaeon]